MNYVYKLTHERTLETELENDEKICDIKLLGFFTTDEDCKKMIPLYLKQPGFKVFPDDFVVEKVEADIDDFNEVLGDFKSSVFYLSHEWHDGRYDHVSSLGYYSSKKNAQKAMMFYQMSADFHEHIDGFCIDEYEIDKCEWAEGFFSY